MKKLIFLLLFFSSPLLFAATASEAYSNFEHNFGVHLGYTPGGFSFGGEYEMPFHRTFGLGAYLKIQGKEDEAGAFGGAGVTAIGAFIRPHFNRGAWDLYVSPGFGIYAIDAPKTPDWDDATALGPSIDIGLTYQLKDNMAVGVSYFKNIAWFVDDWGGQALIDTLYGFWKIGI